MIVDSRSQTSVLRSTRSATRRTASTLPGRDPRSHAFADSVFGGKETTVDHTHVPTAVFTTPEIGTVG